jgi:hypothetical protein
LKDLDFTDVHEKIRVDPLIARALIQQIEDDAKLFQRLNINDYSLLLGIHRFQDKSEADHIKRVSPNISHFINNSFMFTPSQQQQQHPKQPATNPPLPQAPGPSSNHRRSI